MKDPKIFVDSYQFTITLFHRTKAFPKAIRPTLGRRLEEQALEMTQALRRALLLPVKSLKNGQGGASSPRLRLLQEASNHLDDLRVLLDMSRDLQVLPIAGFEELARLSREIGREIGGLLKKAA